MTEYGSEVFDLGYQHYKGPREGRMRARKTIWTNGMRTAMGLGRGTRAKILPVMLVIFTITPAVIMALVAAAAGSGDDIPSHGDYYRVISIILLLFSAIIAPELLCPDRRNGVIYLYLVRPLTVTDYITGRWMAFFTITTILIWAGQLILFIGLAFSSDESLNYLRDNWLDVPRFLGAGIAIAVFTTTLALAASAFTTRRAYATAFVIALYFVSAPLAGILTSCEPDEGPRGFGPEEVCEAQTGEAAKWLALLDIGQVPNHVSDLILDDENESHIAKFVGELPAAIPVVWYLILTAGPGFLLWKKYRNLRL
ncbi:MAG: hypothetical protein R6U89_07510 [Dehalococcoidia bacterium]